MINIRFEEREKIGLQYALETLHGCSPFGQEKIRKLRYYSPDEREELETELYNVEQAAKSAALCAGARRWRSRIMWSCLKSRYISSGWRV